MWVWDGPVDEDDVDAPLILNGEFMDPTLWDLTPPPF